MQEILIEIKNFLNVLGLDIIAQIVGILVALTGVIAAIWKYIRKIDQYFQESRIRKDLHPFYSPFEIKQATKYYVPTKGQNISPSREHEPRQHAFAAKEEIIPFFINKSFKDDVEDNRFHLILADSGMGKTTFLITLYLRYKSIFSISRYDIKLFPLASPEVDNELDKMSAGEKAKTILLLDAFDEDSKAVLDYQARMAEIIQKVKFFRKVIITCRTQFFPNEEEEPNETGLLKFGIDKGQHTFHKLYISPFNDRDIEEYLKKKFSVFSYKKRHKARQIVKNAPNLMVRPMLLSYIDDLLETNQQYRHTYMLYAELVKRWLNREAIRVPSFKRSSYEKELYKFSKVVAIDIYKNRQKRNGQLIIYGEDIKYFAETYNIKLEEMEMRSRSLLNRNSAGEYKFSHRSILEYFLSLEIFENKEFREEFNFTGMDQVKKFYDEMVFQKVIDFLDQNRLEGSYLPEIGKKEDLSQFRSKVVSQLMAHPPLNPLSVSKFKAFLKSYFLALEGISITYELIDILQEFRNLEQLELRNVQINNISCLKALKNLKEINITVDLFVIAQEERSPITRFQSEQIDALKLALPDCSFSYKEDASIFNRELNKLRQEIKKLKERLGIDIIEQPSDYDWDKEESLYKLKKEIERLKKEIMIKARERDFEGTDDNWDD